MYDPFCSTICWSFCLSPIDALDSFAENQMALAARVYFRVVCSILIEYVSFVFYVSTKFFLNYHTQFNLEPDITIPPTLLIYSWCFGFSESFGLLCELEGWFLPVSWWRLMKLSEAFFLLSTTKSSIILTALYLCVTHSFFAFHF